MSGCDKTNTAGQRWHDEPDQIEMPGAYSPVDAQGMRDVYPRGRSDTPRVLQNGSSLSSGAGSQLLIDDLRVLEVVFWESGAGVEDFDAVVSPIEHDERLDTLGRPGLDDGRGARRERSVGEVDVVSG